MFMHSNLTSIFTRTQRWHSIHVLLLCFSMLMVGFIVYVHYAKLAKFNAYTKFHKIFALKLDRRAEPSFRETLSSLAIESPSLPFEFLYLKGYSNFQNTNGCAALPDLYSLDYFNSFWQTFKNGKVLMRIYGAYYDRRYLDASTAVVRILVMLNSMQAPTTPNFCQIWFDDSTSPLIIEVTKFQPLWPTIWRKSPSLLYPYVLSCVLAAHRNMDIPKMISIAAKPCQNATNLLKVFYEPTTAYERRETFGICVEGLSEPLNDISWHLIDWLELLHQFELNNVYFNIYDVQPNVTKILQYYKDKSVIQARLTTLGNKALVLRYLQHILLQSDQLNRRLHDALFAHDCFYRNLYRFDYMIVVDINAVPQPLQDFKTWHSVLKYAKNSTKCKHLRRLCFQNTLNAAKSVEATDRESDFLVAQVLEVPRSVVNASKTTCWHNTDSVILLDDHISKRTKDCSLELEPNIAQMTDFSSSIVSCYKKDITFRTALKERKKQFSAILNSN